MRADKWQTRTAVHVPYVRFANSQRDETIVLVPLATYSRYTADRLRARLELQALKDLEVYEKSPSLMEGYLLWRYGPV